MGDMCLTRVGSKGMSEEVTLETGQPYINVKEGKIPSSQASSSVTSDGAVPLWGTLITM